jgi:hypothetical protein
MSFGHPSQQSHKLAGFAKAAKSPNTPAHLRSHLQNLSQGGTMAKGKSFPMNKQRRGPMAKIAKAPKLGNASMQSALPNDSDAESIEPSDNSSMFFGTKTGKQRKSKASAFYGGV